MNRQGYTVLRVWGSYYEMGYAHASVLGESIAQAVDQTKVALGNDYASARALLAASVWLPLENEAELDGMVDCLSVTYRAAGIDRLDLKVLNTLGDWLYACRSHTCWGRYVTAPVKTLSTRRLDFSTAIPILNHHVLIAYDPNDGSPEWLNMAWPGIVTVAQGINEYGTLVSLHDYQSFPADLSAGCISRLVAARYALTYIVSNDLSTQLEHVFTELQDYEIMTGGFINYYAPLGFGGVISCSPRAAGPDFYRLRRPQAVWHHGEAMVTTNQDTSGTYTPSDEDIGVDAYYNDESPKTHESHWHLVDPVTANHGLSRLSVAYRGRRDMTVWADGRLDGIGRTPRLEYEWSELFDTHAKYSGGTGGPNDPYQIATAADLIALGETPDDYDKHFKLMADIDLAEYSFGTAVIAPDADPCDLAFQGTSFTGRLDGSGHVVSHLTISGEHYLGLFGRLGDGSEIKNLAVVDVNITGSDYVSGLVGFSRGNISTSCCTGSVGGNRFVGGLTGRNWGSISASCSTATVTGNRHVGGLAAGNYGSIADSYSTGATTADWEVGGLVGANSGSITTSYSAAAVGGEGRAGGLAGYSYWDYAVITSSFWDTEVSGLFTSDGGTGKTTTEMQTAATFLDAGWDFDGKFDKGTDYIWWILEGQDYPRLWWEGVPVLVVDDFESYDDEEGNRVCDFWVGGFFDERNGSLVGYTEPPWAEQTIVHSGGQSMPFHYDNRKVMKSEATRQFAPLQNWVADNPDTLTLHFRGEADNDKEALYAAVEDTFGNIGVVTHPHEDAVLAPEWRKWHIALADLQAEGVDLAMVRKMHLGVGNRNQPRLGGKGKIYIDDIWLTKRMR